MLYLIEEMDKKEEEKEFSIVEYPVDLEDVSTIKK